MNRVVVTCEPYTVGWTAPMTWWEWAGLLVGCTLLWPLRLAAAGLEASGRALADWVESP